MALNTYYFDVSSAGAADGSSWANRAALFSSGNWSSVITGYGFNTNAMLAYVAAGSYTCSQALASGLFTNAPTIANPLIFHGCDTSGNALTPPDPNWLSCEPYWTTSGLPVIATTTNINTSSLNHVQFRLVKLTASGRNSTFLSGETQLDWCYLVSSTSNVNAATYAPSSGNGVATNCIFECTASSYDFVVGGGNSSIYYNCRIVGVTGSGGDRDGVESAVAALRLIKCTIVNNGGLGVQHTSSSTGGNVYALNCVIANNGGDGLECNGTASQTNRHHVERCMLTGNGGYGLDFNTNAYVVIGCSRLRDNTSGNINGLGNYPTTFDVYTTDDSDANEYVDASNGTPANQDFTIKNTATIWGSGYGVKEQAAAAASGVQHRPNLQGGFQ